MKKHWKILSVGDIKVVSVELIQNQLLQYVVCVCVCTHH